MHPQIAAYKKTKIQKLWSFMQMSANFCRRDRTKLSRVKSDISNRLKKTLKNALFSDEKIFQIKIGGRDVARTF